MYKLIIKKPDGSLYWQDYFPSKEAGDSWLKEEMTRPYWKAEYTVEIEDNVKKQEDASKAAIKAFQDMLEERKVRQAQIKALKDKASKTPQELEQLVNLLADHVL